LLCEAKFPGTRLIDLHMQLGHIDHLMQMHVLHAAYLTHPLRDLARNVIRDLTVHARNLNIDRRRQAKVQNLADNVGGLEEKREMRKPARQFTPQFCDVVRCRLRTMMRE
jgi:hypothetical protein